MLRTVGDVVPHSKEWHGRVPTGFSWGEWPAWPRELCTQWCHSNAAAGNKSGGWLGPPPGSMEADCAPAPAWRPHPGPHPDPSGGGTATAEVPGQGLRREAPFFGASGPSAAEGLREDPARSPCGSAPSHQLLRGHERPVGGHRQGHLAGAVTPGAVTPQNHRSIRRQSQFWSRENLLKISNS